MQLSTTLLLAVLCSHPAIDFTQHHYPLFWLLLVLITTTTTAITNTVFVTLFFGLCCTSCILYLWQLHIQIDCCTCLPHEVVCNRKIDNHCEVMLSDVVRSVKDWQTWAIIFVVVTMNTTTMELTADLRCCWLTKHWRLCQTLRTRTVY